MELILVICTLICAAGWAVNRIAAMALIRYMKEKKYTPPSTEETKACTRWAVKKLLHIKADE